MFGYLAGFFMYNSISPFFLFSNYVSGLTILLLLEFNGVAICTVIIERLQKIQRKTAFIAMTAAILINFALGWLTAIIFIYLAWNVHARGQTVPEPQ